MWRILLLALSMLLSSFVSAKEVWECDIRKYTFFCDSRGKDLSCKYSQMFVGKPPYWKQIITFSETRQKSDSITFQMGPSALNPSSAPQFKLQKKPDPVLYYEYEKSHYFDSARIISSKENYSGERVFSSLYLLDFGNKTISSMTGSSYTAETNEGTFSSYKGNCRQTL